MSSVKDKMKQKRISQFFNNSRSDPAEEEETDGASTSSSTYDHNRMAIDIDQEDEDDDEVGITGKKEKNISPEDSSLPPISRLPDIFLDIVSRLSEVKTLAEHIKGRTLRVATMCSGTESPLLALNLISRAMTEMYGTHCALTWSMSSLVRLFPLSKRTLSEIFNHHSSLSGCM